MCFCWDAAPNRCFLLLFVRHTGVFVPSCCTIIRMQCNVQKWSFMRLFSHFNTVQCCSTRENTPRKHATWRSDDATVACLSPVRMRLSVRIRGLGLHLLVLAGPCWPLYKAGLCRSDQAALVADSTWTPASQPTNHKALLRCLKTMPVLHGRCPTCKITEITDIFTAVE